MHRPVLQNPSKTLYFLLAVVCAATLVPFARVLVELYGIYNFKPEYSHGVIIPLLSAFLIWRRREELRRLPFEGSWLGVILIAAGLVLRWIGESTTLRTVEHYALLVVIYGAVLSLIGPKLFRRLWFPLLLLVFAMPLPSIFDNALSLQLQLWSSDLGVLVIRAAGVSVLLEGNIIDLGTYKLEVAEACSGLRYLLPLMTLSFIIAYLYRAPMWKRVAVVVSSIPITVLMNGLRIGVIGITVDRWGQSMAEGFLHEFEGWVVFMFSTLAVMGVALGLSRIGVSGNRTGPLLSFGEPPAPTDIQTPAVNAQSVPVSFVAAAALVVVGALVGRAFPAPAVVTPARTSFDAFPTTIGAWQGERETLDSIYLDKLLLDDYVQMNFRSPAGDVINFYSSYYATQDVDRHVHSPRDCIPGGGWEIQKFEEHSFPGSKPGQSFMANRAIIQLDTNRALVYYWFEVRGRRFTSDYKMKWYLMWDALTKHRTDGALVRYVMPLSKNESEADADARMLSFASTVNPLLPQYIPD
jgi:exosortase D (VPLPA-CTERM-specific)